MSGKQPMPETGDSMFYLSTAAAFQRSAAKEVGESMSLLCASLDKFIISFVVAYPMGLAMWISAAMWLLTSAPAFYYEMILFLGSFLSIALAILAAVRKDPPP
jgi:hypothetical protein